MMNFLRNIQNASLWNVGFCDCTPEQLLEKKSLPPVKWLKHPYRDRFFADPFILKVSETEIVIFAEEYVFDNPPGRIVELVIDRRTMCLKNRNVMLQCSTHLSYPAIIREGGKIYVYPENGHSGHLNKYLYDAGSHCLVDPLCILNESVADSTIVELQDGRYLLVATKYPETQEKCFAYRSDSLATNFMLISDNAFQRAKECSRPAGDFFKVRGELYRPAQDCSRIYGGAIAIMKFNPDTLLETKEFVLPPCGRRYSIGIHTINFLDNLCVIDGLGYYYPLLGRVYYSKLMKTIRNFVNCSLRRK